MDPETTRARFPELETGVSVKNGIILERDVPVKLRDGITIYTDIYRPEGQENIPAIVVWSPYGKRTCDAQVTAGVPEGTLSEGTKLEGPDPDYWCRQGYALVNPDPRGVGNSEGIVQIWTREEAKDSAELIDWVGTQSWCNGRVGMAGNSWLSIGQWAAASERPEHLACIAPWEGSTDVYKQIFCRGGIPDTGFSGMFDTMTITGNGMAEDFSANIKAHPMEDEYWQDKRSPVENIEIPAYVCGGWQHFHLPGSIEGFNRLSSKNKWLRVHREFEWPDQYNPVNLAELKLFFDRYLKGYHNGWELTPRVRIDVMDRGDRDHTTRRPEISFPLPDTKYRKLYLNAENSLLQDAVPEKENRISYDAVSGQTFFEYTFDEDTELTGYFKLHLWVEAKGAEDMDLFIAVQKADRKGDFVPTLVMGHAHPGPEGMLRVSHRKLNEEKSTEFLPVCDHLEKQLLHAGEIVPVDIPIWPSSRMWHKGEKLRVAVSGHYLREGWVEPLIWATENQGEHIIHTGGKYESYILVPEIPAEREVIPGTSTTSAVAKSL